jgi:hypothetical protein
MEFAVKKQEGGICLLASAIVSTMWRMACDIKTGHRYLLFIIWRLQ